MSSLETGRDWTPGDYVLLIWAAIQDEDIESVVDATKLALRKEPHLVDMEAIRESVSARWKYSRLTEFEKRMARTDERDSPRRTNARGPSGVRTDDDEVQDHIY